ncbi:MAG: hypothetical protein DRN10_03605 [Thermoplasmata archaeon]|nr:MAG: hypothetical protein DRN10_03605 [Thermoplasmata archaeon]RLF63190.1 MAG: hypothetical protein DRN31_02935 [Thermoplasmata archaeon]
MTDMYAEQLASRALISNAGVDIQVFVKPDAQEGEYNMRIYAKPDVEPVFAVYSLIAEGRVDAENTMEFYSQQNLVDAAKDMIK